MAFLIDSPLGNEDAVPLCYPDQPYSAASVFDQSQAL